MSRKVLLITALIIVTFIGYATLITTVKKKELVIKEPHQKVRAQMAEIEKISKWYIPFAGSTGTHLTFLKNNKVQTGSNSLTLDKIDAAGNWLTAEAGNKHLQVLMNVVPDTGVSTRVTLEYESTLLQEVAKSNSLIEDAKKSLANFQQYFNDSKKMYGYDIEITKVSDTAFLFTSAVASLPEKKQAIQNLYQKLMATAEKNKNEYNGSRIFYSSPFGKDSVHLFTGIGISNTAIADITGDVAIKRMPYKMNLLATFYQGPFKGTGNAIDALAQFKTDNNLVSMAIPFIKFITEGTSFSDDQIIQATVCYPVF